MSKQIIARRDMFEEPVICGADAAIVTLPRGETAAAEPVQAQNKPEIILREQEHRADVLIGGRLFTSYVFDPAIAKPYLGPIIMSNGQSVTRLDLTAKEHPHQRSIIIAVGDVSANGMNNVDFWNEPENRGRERHTGFTSVTNGVNIASFTAANIWESADGVPMLDEKRTFTFYAQSPACRYIDIHCDFTASMGEVVFGATKEAGPLGIRMADALRVDHGGHILNCYGAENEEECWGRCASWCSYYGSLDGLDCGVAVFDNEDNERYPTAWHSRNYGLFAANNLYFKGPLTIAAGETLTYKYRVAVFEGKCDFTSRFLNYAK